MSNYQFAFSDQPVPSTEALTIGFTIKASPSTDIWAKPPSKLPFNSPILYKSAPLPSFKRARVHISANWGTLYDQGGLILVLNRADGTRKWIKTGIEFVNNKPHVSTVAKDNWADWSLLSIPSGGREATIEMQRVDAALWIYLIEGAEKTPIREITWPFIDEETTECWIGPYVAKPSSDGQDLEVTFKDLEIELA
ncbi:hypothetical protein FQN50_002464 [Emmonsiellopsis sp. PD_5]|nr:hypothetical protein FQN50_002464 [Emmonsiellopsis sp. PD_5]